MKRKLLFILLISTFVLILSKVCSVQASSRYSRNVEGFLDDEWGGGHSIGHGQIVWYEYSKTTTEFYDWVTINGVSVPKYKTIVTCHGYGDLHCEGYYYHHD